MCHVLWKIITSIMYHIWYVQNHGRLQYLNYNVYHLYNHIIMCIIIYKIMEGIEKMSIESMDKWYRIVNVWWILVVVSNIFRKSWAFFWNDAAQNCPCWSCSYRGTITTAKGHCNDLHYLGVSTVPSAKTAHRLHVASPQVISK